MTYSDNKQNAKLSQAMYDRSVGITLYFYSLISPQAVRPKDLGLKIKRHS